MKRFRKQALAVFAALCMLAALGQPDVRAAGGQVRVTVENTTFTSKNADGEDPPWSGTLVDTQVPLTEGMSMMDAIVKALAGYEILGADKGYITTIHGLAEFDNGNQSGWVGTLDGWFTNRGFQAFTTDNGGLEDGDEIRVMYTSKAGDTGNSWEDTSTRLQAVAASAGTLVPGFDSETFAYTLFLPAGTGEVNIRPTAKNNSFAVRVYKGQDPDLSGRGYKPAAYIPVSGGDVVSVVSGYTPWTQIGNTDVTGGFHTLEGEGVSHYRITIAYGEPPEGTATPTPAPTTVVTATPEPTTVVTTTPTPTTVVTTTPTPTTAGTTTPAPTTTTTPTPAPTAIVTATPAPTATVVATATPAAIATPAATAGPTPGSGTNAPGAPVGRPAIAKVQTAAYNKLQVTWNRTAGAQGYEVARSFSKNSGYQVIRTIPGGTQTACTDTALDTGRTYYYKVRAYRAVNGNRIYSSYSAARAGVPQLDRPTLKAAAGKGRAKLKWNRVKGANGYLVYRAASKNGTYKKLKTVQSSPAVSYTDKKLKAGKVYFYKIKAYRTVNTKKVYSPFSAPKRVEGE